MVPVEVGAVNSAVVDVEIADLAYDSRRVDPGALFFCVRGERSDGHDHAAQAVAAGAAALVVERPLGLGVPEVVVGSARAAMGPVAARFHGDPTRELKVVGVTGTNGKTTTAYLVRTLLEAGGHPCGLLGTVTSVVGGAEERPTGRRLNGISGRCEIECDLLIGQPAHDPGGDRSAGRLSRDARWGRSVLRDGGLLARA